MPELPEVETVKNYLSEKILNKKIINTKVLNAKLRWPINSKGIRDIKGQTISKVTRRGKYILLQFNDTKLTMIIHLGMTGIFRLEKLASIRKKNTITFFYILRNFFSFTTM